MLGGKPKDMRETWVAATLTAAASLGEAEATRRYFEATQNGDPPEANISKQFLLVLDALSMSAEDVLVVDVSPTPLGVEILLISPERSLHYFHIASSSEVAESWQFSRGMSSLIDQKVDSLIKAVGG